VKTNPIFWKFILVTKPFEKIKVLRTRDGRPANIFGTMPRGFSCWLTFGDRVFVKNPGKRWALKFKVLIRPGKKNYPAIKYGKLFGPYPNQYRAIRKLPASMFAKS
jgi:hypothetical protein